ncbi:hypothetical protein JET14_17895 [Martelella lutilitoris]|uniref:DUF3313 domain-containing protein n=1 Tax=Martelella lutilitoris TaxID=2583532 RepID=A0A7T7HJ37_9HYPH|nr:hypothetical protein [Martelella lutilitoris]QQM30129.1 hypothetical protein JET14_17895 [Martelella lutilitoris]
MFRSFLVRACCFVGLLVSAACSTIGGVAPAALEAVSPLDADLATLVIEVTKPAALPVDDNDLALALRWDVPGQERLEEEAGLRVSRRTPAAAAADRLAGGARDTVDLVLAPEDAVRMAELLARIRRDKQEGIDGKGALSVSFTAHCVEGGADLSGMTVDVALTLEPDQPPIDLMRDAKIGRLLESHGRERLPDCRKGPAGGL